VPRDLERTAATAADRQQRDRGRLALGPRGEGQLPPVALEAVDPALRLDRLAQLVVDLTHRRRRRAAEEARLEDDVVARSGLAGHEASRRPVVLGEDKGGEVDFVGQLDQPIERREARVEDGRPRVDVGDVPEAARQRRQELLLLPR
jgi:hypothetical protein